MRATADDAPRIIALIGRVYAEYGFIWDPRVEVPDLFDFDAHYALPRGAFYVVRRGDDVAGSVGVERLDEETAELHRLYLDASLRGIGVGRALVEAVLAWCRGRRIGALTLWSDTRFADAHRLYTRMGFARTGERDIAGDVNATREFRFDRRVEGGNWRD